MTRCIIIGTGATIVFEPYGKCMRKEIIGTNDH